MFSQTTKPTPIPIIIHGVNAQDRSGRAVSDAGDVNGDGLDDVIVGAYFADSNGSDSGSSYVIFGKETTSTIQLSDVESNTDSSGFAIYGANAGDRSGISVSSAGDVNGDGLDDVIVGAYFADPNGSESGTSYVIFGKATTTALELSNIESDTGAHGFAIYGASGGDRSGISVSGAGDVNGDGFDDVIVGAYLADPEGKGSAGTSYVVFGKASTTAVALSSIETDMGDHGFAINGVDGSDSNGISVSGAGDVNNDGLDDVIVGSYFADPNGGNSGTSYVVFGKLSTTPINLANIETDMGGQGFAIHGAAGNDRSGFSVSAAGDVNSDGFDDVIVGAYTASINGSFSGSSYVVFGRTATTPIDLSDIKDSLGSNGFAIHGAGAADYSGRSVSDAGDINGDGFDDVIVGAWLADPNGENSGSSYVIFGKTTTTPINLFDIESETGGHGIVINGAGANDRSGLSVSGAGDLNRDGLDDVIVGSYFADPNSNTDSGTSYVVFGRRGSTEAVDLTD